MAGPGVFQYCSMACCKAAMGVCVVGDESWVWVGDRRQAVVDSPILKELTCGGGSELGATICRKLIRDAKGSKNAS